MKPSNEARSWARRLRDRPRALPCAGHRGEEAAPRAARPKVSVVFENHDTVLLQIQEMLRTERITRPAAIQHEIDTYNELVPGPDELSAP